MGMMNKGTDKARARQREAIIEEAGRSGARVLSVVVSGDDPSAVGVVGSVFKAFVGGKTTIDDVQVFSFETQGFAHLFVQPYDGINALPGLHRATLPGSVPHSTILKAKSFGRSKWFGPDDKEVESLNANPLLGRATSNLEWKWRTGTTEISLPWTVQMRPAANATTEVALRSGRYGGFTTFGVGVGVFIGLCGALHALTTPIVTPEASFIIDVGF